MRDQRACFQGLTNLVSETAVKTLTGHLAFFRHVLLTLETKLQQLEEIGCDEKSREACAELVNIMLKQTAVRVAARYDPTPSEKSVASSMYTCAFIALKVLEEVHLKTALHGLLRQGEEWSLSSATLALAVRISKSGS
jgi:hypothetical protein